MKLGIGFGRENAVPRLEYFEFENIASRAMRFQLVEIHPDIARPFVITHILIGRFELLKNPVPASLLYQMKLEPAIIQPGMTLYIKGLNITCQAQKFHAQIVGNEIES